MKKVFKPYAFEVSSDDDYQNVVFATSKADLEELGYLVDKRLPEFDKYWNLGFVPKEVLIQRGYYFECDCDSCSSLVPTYDEENPEYINGNQVFCSFHCFVESKKTENLRKIRKEQIIAVIRSQFSRAYNFHVFQFRKNLFGDFKLPHLNKDVTFKLTGIELKLFIQVADKENWESNYK